jgi:hypothetical protein
MLPFCSILRQTRAVLIAAALTGAAFANNEQPEWQMTLPVWPGSPEARQIAAATLAGRPKPPIDLAVEKTFRVTDYDAKPDSSGDSLPALRAAIAAAAASGRPSAVVLPKGVYHLNAPEDGSLACLQLDGAHNIVLDGSGSELILTNPRRGFIRLTECRNIILKNFSIDYDPLPFTQGIVRAVNAKQGAFDVEIQPGFPPLDAPHLREPDVGFLKDSRHPGRQKPDVANFHEFTGITRLGPDEFRVQLAHPDQIRDFAPGDYYVSIGRRHSTGALLSASLCNQVTCQNITCYSAPGANYVAWCCDALNVIGCQTRIRAGRWQSTNADGVHCQSNRVGPWIEDCMFEGMADDGVNVYTLPLKLRSAPLDNWIPCGNEYQGRKGDLLTLFDPLTGRILDTFSIAEADPLHRRVRLDHPLPAGLTYRNDNLTPSLYNGALACPYTVIHHNTFQDYRGRGLLIKSHWCLVQDNRFDGVSNCAIQVMNNSDVPEGLQAEHVSILGNWFKDCGCDAPFKYMKGAADISVFFSDGRGNLAVSRGEQDICIENNLIQNWRRSAVYLGGAERASVAANVILNNGEWAGRPGEPNIPIRIENSDDVTVIRNVVTDTRPLSSKVEAGASCGKVTTH